MRPLAILAPRGIAVAVGSAVALRLAVSGPVAAVVLRPEGSAPSRIPAPPPTPAAARQAAALRRAGHPATAAWRLVRCEVDSADEAGEIIELLGDAGIPHVLVPTAARSREVEALLESSEAVLASADDEVGLAVADSLVASDGDLAGIAARTVAMPLEPAGATIALPLAGIGCPGAWIDPIDRVIAYLEDPDRSAIDSAARSDGGSRVA